MRRVNYFITCLILTLFAGSLCGCGGVEVPSEGNYIAIDKEGVVTQHMEEEFGDEYSVDDLQDAILSEVSAYNKKLKEGEVAVSKVEEKDGKIIAEMTFPSAADVEAFYNMNGADEIVFFYGTVADGYAAGIDLDVTLHERENDSTLISRSDILGMGEDMLLVYDPAMNNDGENYSPVEICLPEKTAYLSDNATVVSEQNVSVASSDALAYVIIKK